MLRISSDSSSVGEGRMVGMRFATMDFPLPGGPIMIMM